MNRCMWTIVTAGLLSGWTALAAGQTTQATQAVQSAPASRPAAARYNPDELLLCSGRHVFALRLEQDWSRAEPVWMWNAFECPQIPVHHRGWFKAFDDCKPVLGGTHVLATSSAGGFALINRADNTCAIYGQSTNAHSAELVGDRWIAVCSSLRGNQLQIFDRHDERRPARPLAAIPLAGAHGAVYDWRREVLWALGTDEILQTRIVADDPEKAPEIQVMQRYPLPARGGHDLFPCFHYKFEKGAGRLPQTARGLFVTVWEHVYVFDVETGEFRPFEPLADTGEIKSITDNLLTGQIAYSQADPESSFSQTARFLNPKQTRQLTPKIGVYDTRLYKMRWNQPNPFSYREDAR